MKKFLSTLILLMSMLAVFVPATQAATNSTVTISLQDCTTGTSTFANRTLWLQGQSLPANNGGAVVQYSKIVTNTDNNGSVTLPLFNGLYHCTVQAPPDRSDFWFIVAANGLVINAGDFLTNNTAAFANTNFPYVARITNTDGTITISPSSGTGVLTISAPGGSSGVNNTANNTNQLWLSGIGTVQDFNCVSFDASAGNGRYDWNASLHSYTNDTTPGWALGFDPSGGSWYLTNSAHHVFESDVVIGTFFSGGASLPTSFASDFFYLAWGDMCGNNYPGITSSYGTNSVPLTTGLQTLHLLSADAQIAGQVKAYSLVATNAIIGPLDMSKIDHNLVQDNLGSGTNLNGSNGIQAVTIPWNRLENTNAFGVVDGFQSSRNYSLNRYHWTNTLPKLRNGQNFTVLYVGSGLIDIDRASTTAVMQNHLVNAGDEPLYGYYVTFASGGVVSNNPTLWFDEMWSLPSSGSTVTFATNNPTANVFEVDYLSFPSGGSFKIQQNINSGGWADVAGFTSISTSDASTNGHVARWTNSPALPTQVRCVQLSGGVLIAAGAWQNTSTNGGVVTRHFTQQSTNPNGLALTPNSVWQPIFTSWAPDMMIWNFNDGGANYLTNFFNTFLANFNSTLPNCDIVAQGLYPASLVLFNNTFPYGCEANAYTASRCLQAGYSYWDCWNYFAPDGDTSLFNARGVMQDGIHLSSTGQTMLADGLWNWLDILGSSCPGTPYLGANQVWKGNNTFNNNTTILGNSYNNSVNSGIEQFVSGASFGQGNAIIDASGNIGWWWQGNPTASITSTNGKFAGDGSLLTNLSPASISGGTFSGNNAFTGSNAFLGTLTIKRSVGTTNAFNGGTLDFSLGNYQFTNTTQNVTITGFSNIGDLSTVPWTVLSVSNGLGSAITVSWPGTLRQYGANSTTSVSVPSAKVWKGTFSVDPYGTNLTASLQNN